MDFTIGVNSSREDLDQITIHQMDLRRQQKRCATNLSGGIRARAAKRRNHQAILQAGACYYCEEYIPKTEWSTEHLTRVADGGLVNNSLNIVMACKECNSSRGDIPWWDWKIGKGKKGVATMLQKGIKK